MHVVKIIMRLIKKELPNFSHASQIAGKQDNTSIFCASTDMHYIVC